MKLAMAALPATETCLKAIKQIGIDHVVHYDMQDLPEDLAALRSIRDRYTDFGLTWKVAESGPAIDQIVMGKAGAGAQIERYKRIVGNLGRVGVEVIVYNFMPQIGPDAMVIRTSYDATTRGGARTSRFRLADVRPETLKHTETPISRERMWDNLKRFLRAVLPAAESAGVRLAMHPDDPPLSPLCGLERIMNKEESFDRLLSLSSSSANAMTFCVGCFAELGSDIPRLIERYRDRIACIHVRNITGNPEDFTETFPDMGNVDLAAVVRKLSEIGYSGYLRSDHAPQLAIEGAETPDGYGIHGHLFTMGYLRGLLHGTVSR